MIFCAKFYFSAQMATMAIGNANPVRYFMQIVSYRDKIHKMSNPVFWKKYITTLLSAELAKRAIKVNLLAQ